MGLENVAVAWPRTGRRYEPVPPAEFAEFAQFASAPGIPASTAALAGRIAGAGALDATPYRTLVDLLLGLDDVLAAVSEEDGGDEDPVIDPDGCAWIAGGLERFVDSHHPHGDEVTFGSVEAVLREALSAGRLAEAQLRWLDDRLRTLRARDSQVGGWRFALSELAVLARYYRHCAERGYAVFARVVAEEGADQP